MCSPAGSGVVEPRKSVCLKGSNRGIPKVIRPLESPKRSHLTLGRHQTSKQEDCQWSINHSERPRPEKGCPSIPSSLRCMGKRAVLSVSWHLHDQSLVHQEIISQYRHRDLDSKSRGGPSSIMTDHSLTFLQRTTHLILAIYAEENLEVAGH